MTQKEYGMLDVGKHCHYCRQVDFLPFHCTSCSEDFCALHRSREEHNCRGLVRGGGDLSKGTMMAVSGSRKGDREAYFKSLLPEKSAVRVNQTRAQPEGSNQSIKDRLIGQKNTFALDKLKKFFDKYSSKKNYKLKLTTSNKTIQLAKMKRAAKGDENIPQSNRVYIWCYCIDEKEPKEYEMFINKVWPLGRVLDYLSQQLNIKNVNLSAPADMDKKLYLYKTVKGSEWVLLEPSARVTGNIDDGDTVYLVRGEDTRLIK
ncbi:Cuz1p Ecym_6393 [Eremothecium cymbalariae DBVPG|uniref:AN1-type domain-containing protein n=1 Tax=Eremothecium cymbalariae (strain CBS 270.75 / DBVPG 7215 / KCTC 17166 / NRRL Y-17582) TaxID=931890 RepID=G8JUI8_ERECY|nr:hypothetical protein Ecym_6393 [Eremothecium cymbalariae DBVPG\